MTIPVWPDELPQVVLVDSFRAGPRGQRLSTAMDSGPAKQRRRGPKTRPLTVAIDLDEDQRARFDRFYEDDTDCGVLPFLIRDMLTDGRGLDGDLGQQVQDENGNDLLIESWLLVQFGQTDPAMAANTFDFYRIQFDLIALP
ncbi:MULTISPECIES: hypothetical protein [unclassified Bradyrhizobium]|uniref:hypothetical protein n=1 Tax=unclassified Bradyrhizobium TaxID=2631580 RepID=UPI001FF97569|nr:MULTISPECIES: hypothetical protein [unclassified Bradyrhizobium]MCK1536889.1 hypothetical protein [Bradyrhizobium sp. 176]MCK1560192.1 hypothetical protein [Bradyrhizobium sp. 171]MCK1693737.1 hypothetical protein [Bradyrhizobium sp. 144]